MFTEDSTRLVALRKELRSLVGEHRYELWLAPPTELRWQAGELVVGCVSQASRQWLQRNLCRQLAAACVAVFGPAARVRWELKAAAGSASAAGEGSAAVGTTGGAASPPSSTVAPPAAWLPPATAASDAAATAASDAASPGEREGPRRRRETRPEKVEKRPAAAVGDRWSFATFAEGLANRLAVQAAREVVRHAGRYSPLVLSGPVGSGKTHLLRAMGAEFRRLPSRPRVVELTAEQFTSQFTEALSQRQSPGFRQKFRSVDALLVDDVQFLAGKRATLAEFLSTLDDLHQRGGQAVLACEGGPAQLHQFSPELASRAAAGLAVGLDPPEYALRQAIVEGIARRCELRLGAGVAELVARRAVGSARLLSGALNRLAAVSLAEGRAIDAALAEEALEAFCRDHTPQFRLADIERAVCQVFGLDASSLKSARKTQHVAQPRMLAMWLARRHTRAALSEIGEHFGRRSHSTVVSAQRKLEQLVTGGSEMRLGERSCRVEEVIRRVEAALHAG